MKSLVLVADACGLCYGAQMAIDKTLEQSKERNNIVLYKEILHNKSAVNLLKNNGIIIKKELNDISKNDYVVIRAHGEPFSTFKFFQDNKINYLDCTCPNVKAINYLVRKKSMEGYKIIIIGKYGFLNSHMHPEVEGIAGWCNTTPIFIEDESEIDDIDLTFEKYYLVTQTTFSSIKAKSFIEKIKNIMNTNNKIFDYKNTICNAQENIKNSSLKLAKEVDVMIVMGGKNSSNSIELYNIMNSVVPSFFIENEDEVIKLLNQNKINANQKIGLTAGASTLKENIYLVKELIENYFVK